MIVTYARSSSQRHVPHSGEESASGSAPRSKQRGELRHLREKHIDSTNEYIEVALILGNIPTTVRIGIGRFQLGADGCKAVVAKKRLPWLQKGLVYAIFVLTSAMESRSVSTCVTC